MWIERGGVRERERKGLATEERLIRIAKDSRMEKPVKWGERERERERGGGVEGEKESAQGWM